MLFLGLLVTVVDAAHASRAVRLRLDDLVVEAERIAWVKVVEEGASAWGSNGRRIYTTYTLEVDEEVAGTGPARFTVVQPGGRVGRLAQKTEGYPTFRKGERVLLFLRRHTRGYRIVGLSQGVFELHRDGEAELLLQRLEGLSFPRDSGFPLLMERGKAVQRIRKLWRKVQTP